jgi:hypothetical protein
VRRLHKDVLNVGAHASVSQNLIALVNDEILADLELHSFVLNEVQQSTRRRYDDVWGVSLVLQLLDVGIDVGASVVTANL